MIWLCKTQTVILFHTIIIIINLQYNCYSNVDDLKELFTTKLSKSTGIKRTELNQCVDRLAKKANLTFMRVAVAEVKLEALEFSSRREPLSSSSVNAMLMKLPLSDVPPDMAQFEDARYALLDYLAGVGGRTVGEATRRVLSRLLTDHVASTYTYKGKFGKPMFQGTLFDQLTIDAVKKIRIEATNLEVEKSIAEWVRQAAGRMKRRISVPYNFN